MLAQIKSDAESIYRREMSKRIPPSGYYSVNDWRFFAVLHAIQGKTLPVASDVFGGVHDMTNVIIKGTTDPGEYFSAGQVHKIQSPVAAIPNYLIEEMIESDVDFDTPVEDPNITPINENHTYGEGPIDTVRLVTTWVDGFQAYKKRPLILS